MGDHSTAKRLRQMKRSNCGRPPGVREYATAPRRNPDEFRFVVGGGLAPDGRTVLSRTTMIAALAAMLTVTAPLALAPGALAQTAATTGAAAPGAAPGQTPAGQLRFTDLHAAAVYDAQNKKIGPIEEVVFERNGRVAAVVLDVGSFLGIGGKRVAVSLNELRIATDESGKPRFQLDLTKDQLISAQAFDLRRPDGAAGSSTPPAGPPRVESGN
jgi:hypothetical protein